MEAENEPQPNPRRKLFFGLFIFPLLIAVGMALLLCTVVFLTNEEETPESLITAIKTGSPSKRWQKAFELSNELNRNPATIRNEGVMKEVIHILRDTTHYDPKTRAYMSLALSYFHNPQAAAALHESLVNDQNNEVQLYVLWALGVVQSKEAISDILSFLKSENPQLRKMAAYVLGVLGDPQTVPSLTPLLEDPVEDIRWNASLSLARLGNDSGWQILAKMLDRSILSANHMNDEEIEKVMINAAKGLALTKREETVPILETLSKEDKSLKVRQAAIEAMEYLKQPQEYIR